MDRNRRVPRYVLPIPAQGQLKFRTTEPEDDGSFLLHTTGRLDRRNPQAWLVAALTHGFSVDVTDHFEAPEAHYKGGKVVRRTARLRSTDAYRFGPVNRLYAKFGGPFRVFEGRTRVRGVDVYWMAFFKVGLITELIFYSSMTLTDADWNRVRPDVCEAAKAQGWRVRVVNRLLREAQKSAQ